MKYVVVDLEATCWRGRTPPGNMEIIEIGAVCMPTADAEPDSEFSDFVRPVVEPKLSDFCKELTTIRQEDVDGAESFPAVFARLLAWAGPPPYRLCSWGAYDLLQFRVDCDRHGVEWPAHLDDHVNLKIRFAELHGSKACGVKRALRRLGLPLEGQHHRGIDDARNIAKLARWILPRIDSDGAMVSPSEGEIRRRRGVRD